LQTLQSFINAIQLLQSTVAGFPSLPTPASPSYANDAAAAVGGVAVGQYYRNGSVIQLRIT
jgi:hypothetical protein